MAAALQPLLEDGVERERMIADLAEIRAKLRPGAGSSAIRRVCDAVDDLLDSRSAFIASESV